MYPKTSLRDFAFLGAYASKSVQWADMWVGVRTKPLMLPPPRSPLLVSYSLFERNTESIFKRFVRAQHFGHITRARIGFRPSATLRELD